MLPLVAAAAEGGAAAGGAGAAAGRAGAGANPNLQAMQLQSQRTSEGRTRDMLDDSSLSDQSTGEERRPSVLDAGAPTRSYTDAQRAEIEGPAAGGGLMQTPSMELMRQREEQAQMMRTQEQFLGQAPEAGGAPGQAPQGPGAPAAEQQAMETEGEEEEEEEEAAMGEAEAQDQAMRMQAQQQREAAKQRVSDQLRQRTEQQAQEQMQQMMKKSTQTAIRGSLEAAELGGSEVIIPLIILIIQLNVQMLMKYIIRPIFISGFSEDMEKQLAGKPFFDQSLPEDILTIAIDTLLTCAGVCCNPCCMPFTMLMLIGGGITMAAS